MPYPFAHPAAVLPLVRPLGRFAVPSALALGSLAPDLWYLLPGLERGDTHSFSGFAVFCLPAALLAYLAFHLLFKQPLIALLPGAIASRLGRFAFRGLPRASWPAVIVSLAAGAATHVLWDAATHTYEYGGLRVVQHASTLGGTLIVLVWSARWLKRAPRAALPRRDPDVRTWRAAIVATFLVVLVGGAFFGTAHASPLDLASVRNALRTAAVTATWCAGLVFLAYSLLVRLRR